MKSTYTNPLRTASKLTSVLLTGCMSLILYPWLKPAFWPLKWTSVGYSKGCQFICTIIQTIDYIIFIKWVHIEQGGFIGSHVGLQWQVEFCKGKCICSWRITCNLATCISVFACCGFTSWYGIFWNIQNREYSILPSAVLPKNQQSIQQAVSCHDK